MNGLIQIMILTTVVVCISGCVWVDHIGPRRSPGIWRNEKDVCPVAHIAPPNNAMSYHAR